MYVFLCMLVVSVRNHVYRCMNMKEISGFRRAFIRSPLECLYDLHPSLSNTKHLLCLGDGDREHVLYRERKNGERERDEGRLYTILSVTLTVPY